MSHERHQNLFLIPTIIFYFQEERAKHVLYEAKYGRITATDPLIALRRDSDANGEPLDEELIGRQYESQLVQLERLIAAHKKSHNRAKMVRLFVI